MEARLAGASHLHFLSFLTSAKVLHHIRLTKITKCLIDKTSSCVTLTWTVLTNRTHICMVPDKLLQLFYVKNHHPRTTVIDRQRYTNVEWLSNRNNSVNKFLVIIIVFIFVRVHPGVSVTLKNELQLSRL